MNKNDLREDIKNINLLAGKAYVIGMIFILAYFIFSIVVYYQLEDSTFKKFYFIIMLGIIIFLYIIDKYIVIDFFVKLGIKKGKCDKFDRKTGFCYYEGVWLGFDWQVKTEKINNEEEYFFVIGLYKSKISKENYEYLLNYFNKNNEIYEKIKQEKRELTFDDLESFNVVCIENDSWIALKKNETLESFDIKILEG